MLRIQRALLWELLFIFFLILLVTTGMVFSGFAIRFIMRGGEALGGALMQALLPKLIPVALSFSLPFSWLAAVALVVGRWVADHEVTALKSAGVHLRTLIVPVAALACVLGVGGMFYNGLRVASAHREVRAKVKDFLPQFLNSLKGADRSISLANGRLSWDRFDTERNVFVGAELDRRSPQGDLEGKAMIKEMDLHHFLNADTGDGLSLQLTEAYVMSAPRGDPDLRWTPESPFGIAYVEKVAASTLFNEFLNTDRVLFRPKDMILPELAYVSARGGVQRGSAKRAHIALHSRLALGASPFFLGLFALGVTLLRRPSTRRVKEFMICFVPAVLIFFPVLLAGPSLALRSGLPVWIPIWASNMLLGAMACVLLYRAVRR